jgi:succinate dehydrogenase hydrophobic anchor subunit
MKQKSMSTREHHPTDTGANGFGQWAGLYISGIVLVVLVLTHIVAVHYAANVTAEGYTLADVGQRLESLLYRLSLLGLLLLGLFHGLTGFHRFVTDLGICGRRSLQVLSVVLTLAGLAGLTYGWFIYRAFLD